MSKEKKTTVVNEINASATKAKSVFDVIAQSGGQTKISSITTSRSAISEKLRQKARESGFEKDVNGYKLIEDTVNDDILTRTVIDLRKPSYKYEYVEFPGGGAIKRVTRMNDQSVKIHQCTLQELALLLFGEVPDNLKLSDLPSIPRAIAWHGKEGQSTGRYEVHLEDLEMLCPVYMDTAAESLDAFKITDSMLRGEQKFPEEYDRNVCTAAMCGYATIFEDSKFYTVRRNGKYAARTVASSRSRIRQRDEELQEDNS